MGCGCKGNRKASPEAVAKREAAAADRRAVYEEARRRLAVGGKVEITQR